jgi:uncharacterized protein YndB with AHSA1/START domain
VTHAEGSRAFAFFTRAEPARVWLALTDKQLTPHYLYGLALCSDWTASATLATVTDRA